MEGGDVSENRGRVHFFKNIFMVAGFKHFPLVLDRLYTINPYFVEFFWKSHGLENIIHFLGGNTITGGSLF